ncbi:Hypothetical protein F387_02032 [Wohlfahrtiimonas chitiniclastica SH04]|uniref:Uncharacterized protein n=1 Tax=Wohlfahrtiimonas chitiniclastica SH04 TaxID=1261130 RepID=L8XT52_9GAMM|nr:hypothetical protein [Wohlfahrtiimonas chitiniclastica]ELV07213.1 Hypothetical protein F387_02032 [Wohlfahrtiimonas chitiniclastica SH04]MBS7821604.1 hypothetical protein [Wohlfahrtiimonas chitiniclastica]MBS7839197.1 hypothetical protein [Wohlfahrtiimonas chitiniclastica]
MASEKDFALTVDELNELYRLIEEGKIAEVWAILGQKGDAYAFLASVIVEGDDLVLSH